MGLKTFNGRRCIHGHDGGRYVSNAQCMTCKGVENGAYYQSNGEAVRSYQADYRGAGPEAVRSRHAGYRARNPDKRAANKAKRRGSKLQATPDWLTKDTPEAAEANRAIAAVFTFTKAHGLALDHVVPFGRLQVQPGEALRPEHGLPPGGRRREHG